MIIHKKQITLAITRGIFSFATLALTVFAQARNWQLGHEKYASILFATLALTVSQQLSKCYQHIFYKSFIVGESIVCFLKKLC